MPPLAETQSEDPTLEDLSMRTTRRALRAKQKNVSGNANTASILPFQTNQIPFTEKPPTPANDNELKAKQIAENPYLAKPANENYNPSVSKEVNDSNLDRTHIGQVEEARRKGQQGTTQDPLRKYTNDEEVRNRAQALHGVAGEESRQTSIKHRNQKLKKQIVAVQNVFKEHKIDITSLEAKQLLKKGFKSNFPAGLFIISLVKDVIIDPVLAVFSLGSFGLGLATSTTIVGVAPGIGFMGAGVGMGIFSFFFSLFLGAVRRWMGRLYFSSVFGRSKVVQKIMRKQILGDLATTVADSIPAVNILPLPMINLWRKISLVSRITRKCRVAVDAIK